MDLIRFCFAVVKQRVTKARAVTLVPAIVFEGLEKEVLLATREARFRQNRVA